MWLQFFAQNAHFGINLFASLFCLGICWLYFDAWSNHHKLQELLKWLGFASLGLSFLLSATVIEQSVLGKSLFVSTTSALVVAFRLAGYIAIILGQIAEPLQAVPKNKGLVLIDEEETAPAKTKVTTKTKKSHGIMAGFGLSIKWLTPVAGLTVAALYFRRATIGLERHLKPVAYAFLLFALADTLSLSSLLRTSSNPIIFSWVAAFGIIWWLQHIALLAGVIVLGIWTWSYLAQRFFSQLFMIFASMIVVVFLIVSVGFTGLLLKSVQSELIKNLKTASSVLNYAISSKKAEASSSAGQLAGNSEVVAAINSSDRSKLKAITSTYLVDKKLSDVIITNQSGMVLLRAKDTEQWGDSMSDNQLTKRALLGLNQSTVTIKEAVTAPSVEVRSAVAVKDQAGNVVGSITTSLELGSASVDGIKQATGLQSSIYGGNKLSATTLLAADGKTRTVGSKINNKSINTTVLDKGDEYSGAVDLQHRKMLVSIVPLKDVDNDTVGMIATAIPESSSLATAGHSVEVTFIMTALLLVASIYPIILITRGLVRQIN